MIAQERIKMEKIYGDLNRSGGGDSNDGEQHQTTGSNVSFKKRIIGKIIYNDV